MAIAVETAHKLNRMNKRIVSCLSKFADFKMKDFEHLNVDDNDTENENEEEQDIDHDGKDNKDEFE